MSQSWEKASELAMPGVLFRNAWPPNFAAPGPGFVYIHQQAFEFQGIPGSWVHPMNDIAQEVWVPSEYNAQAFKASGVRGDKIAVLRHGVEFGKYNVSIKPLTLPSRKGFKLLFNGGLLPRKGIDVLLKAYTEAFLAADNVSLIIHSVYGDDFYLKEILELQKDPNVPEIIFFRDDLTHFEMIQLYKAADVYVSPYRSEGFGLTLLEAMAVGLQVIVTNFGPSTEICPTNVGACLLIDAEPTQCTTMPCGKMHLFGESTVQQPSWSEPKVESLKRHMREAFQTWQDCRSAMCNPKELLMGHAKKQKWYDVGSAIISRILLNLEAYGNKTTFNAI